jgi:hypothetical protein
MAAAAEAAGTAAREIAAEATGATRGGIKDLNSPSQKFEDQVPNQCRDNGNDEIFECDDLLNRPQETAALAHSRRGKLSHQEVRIKKEYDKAGLDHRSPDRTHFPEARHFSF